MSPNNTDEQKAVPSDLNNNVLGLKPTTSPDLTASSSMSEPSMPEAPVMPSSDESDMKVVPNPNSPMGSDSTPTTSPDLTASSSMSEPSMPEAPVMPSSDESDMKVVPNPNSPMGSDSTPTTSPVAPMTPGPINSDNSTSIEPQQPSAFVPAQPQMQVHKPVKNHSKTIILITSLILLILLGVLVYVFLKTKK